MASGTAAPHAAPATKVVVRVVVYYAVLFGLAWLVGHQLLGSQIATRASFAALSSAGMHAGRAVADPTAGGTMDETTLAVTVVVAMLAAALLSLPVAWVYLLTRAKRGYQQSVVQMLIMLPMVVAGVVVLVRDSLALAFALAGIVAAVRFRNTLDDSKDAVYVFLATGIGLAAAVALPVAAVLSILFNAAILALWYTDFGRMPVQLEGKAAERRLQRARALARTGTFVARIDDEVFREMTAEQLDGVVERARRRARQHDPETASQDGAGTSGDGEAQLLVRTRDVAAARRTVEPQLDEHVKRWRFGGAVPGSDGTTVVEYLVTLKKRERTDDLLATLRAAGAPTVIGADLS